MHELRGYRGNDHSLDTAAVCELFRHLLLRRLHKEERLSERFMENLLSWVHPGFSVFAGEPLSPEDAGQLERLARYVTRPPLAADSIRRTNNGMLEITTSRSPHRCDRSPLRPPRLDPRHHGPHPRSRPALREVLCDAAIYVELGPRSPVNKGPRAPIAPHKNQPHSSVGQAFWWLTKGGMSMLQNFYDSRWHLR